MYTSCVQPIGFLATISHPSAFLAHRLHAFSCFFTCIHAEISLLLVSVHPSKRNFRPNVALGVTTNDPMSYSGSQVTCMKFPELFLVTSCVDYHSCLDFSNAKIQLDLVFKLSYLAKATTRKDLVIGLVDHDLVRFRN